MVKMEEIKASVRSIHCMSAADWCLTADSVTFVAWSPRINGYVTDVDVECMLSSGHSRPRRDDWTSVSKKTL